MEPLFARMLSSFALQFDNKDTHDIIKKTKFIGLLAALLLERTKIFYQAWTEFKEHQIFKITKWKMLHNKKKLQIIAKKSLNSWKSWDTKNFNFDKTFSNHN